MHNLAKTYNNIMASKLFKAVILGAPASGKGTISSRILKKYNLEYISSGDKLRLNIQNKTALGIEVKKYMDDGKLVPDNLMVKFILSEINKTTSGALLLDGFPRTISQAEALWKKQNLDLALNLVVPFDVIIDRVKGRWVHLPSGRVYHMEFNPPKTPGLDDMTGEKLMKRDDDKPEVVKKRLEQYDKLTRPVIQFYRDKGILNDFEGSTSDEIWPKVAKCLDNYLLDVSAQKI